MKTLISNTLKLSLALGLIFCESSLLSQEATPSPSPKQTTNDHFIRVVNLVEPRLTIIWKAGFDVLVDDQVHASDVRSHENTGYTACKLPELKKKWLLRSSTYPSANMEVKLEDPELLKTPFTTIFILGTMKDQSQAVHAQVAQDAVVSPSQASVRVIPAIQSYPVKVQINGSLVSYAPNTLNAATYPAGKFLVTMFWKDGKNRDRKLDYDLLVASGKAYTLVLVDTGEGVANPTLTLLDDTAMAKDALASLPESTASPAPK